MSLAALARRAAPLIRWEAGMSAIVDGRSLMVVGYGGIDARTPIVRHPEGAFGAAPSALPDLAHQLTVLALVAQARDAVFAPPPHRRMRAARVALHAAMERWYETGETGALVVAAIEALEAAGVRHEGR